MWSKERMTRHGEGDGNLVSRVAPSSCCPIPTLEVMTVTSIGSTATTMATSARGCGYSDYDLSMGLRWRRPRHGAVVTTTAPTSTRGCGRHCIKRSYVDACTDHMQIFGVWKLNKMWSIFFKKSYLFYPWRTIVVYAPSKHGHWWHTILLYASSKLVCWWRTILLYATGTLFTRGVQRCTSRVRYLPVAYTLYATGSSVPVAWY
jgi:hypothetical protein